MSDEGRLRLETALEHFMIARESDKRSPLTLKDQRWHLELFIKWLHNEHHLTYVDELQLIHLRGWIVYLQKRPAQQGGMLSDRTVHCYGQTMLTFCHWLEYEEYLSKPITGKFKLPRVAPKFIPTFTPDEVEQLFTACEAGSDYKPPLRKALTARNRAMLSVLIDTGIRRAELAGLRLCDIDRELHLLTVHRKGGKWQQVPISHEGFKPLHEYLMKHRSYLAKLGGRTVAHKEDAVFLTNTGEPITTTTVAMFFRKKLRIHTEIEGKKVSPHNCRRYMATTQLAMGRSPLDVQRQLGHTTLQMTNHYASLTMEHLQRTHDMYSPLRAKNNPGGKSPGSSSDYWDE